MFHSLEKSLLIESVNLHKKEFKSIITDIKLILEKFATRKGNYRFLNNNSVLKGKNLKKVMRVHYKDTLEFSDCQRNYSGIIQVSQIFFNANYNIGKFFINFKNSLNLLEKKKIELQAYDVSSYDTTSNYLKSIS